jgi:hypothetical protein
LDCEPFSPYARIACQEIQFPKPLSGMADRKRIRSGCRFHAITELFSVWQS